VRVRLAQRRYSCTAPGRSWLGRYPLEEDQHISELLTASAPVGLWISATTRCSNVPQQIAAKSIHPSRSRRPRGRALASSTGG
jgi:hypothetical protein